MSFAFVSNLNAELWEIKVEFLCLLINNVPLDLPKNYENSGSQRSEPRLGHREHGFN